MSKEVETSARGVLESKSKPVTAVLSPPPESPETIKAKSWVIYSFWSVVIFLGLPIWWWTTSIHRASLPVQEMLQWSDMKACQLDFPLWINVEAPHFTDVEAKGIITKVDRALAADNIFTTQSLRWNLTKTKEQSHKTREDEAALHVYFNEDRGASLPTVTLLPHGTALDVRFDPNQLKSSYETISSQIGGLLVESIRSVFTEEQSSIMQLLASDPNYKLQTQAKHGNQDVTGSPDINTKISRKRTRALKYAPTYHVSISLFTPRAVPTEWDIDAAILEYLTPLLKSFSISNFTVDTQLQLYAPFSPAMRPPEFDWAKQQWFLREEDLSSFVNAAEWPLSPNIGDGPTLNFILFIPEESHKPLLIKDSGANSWIVPQWGGITIFNPTGPIGSRLSKEQIAPALNTFAHQLLSLLGAPETPTSFPLQIQSLTRIHALSLMLSASSTLGSLARLSQSLSTIPIPEEVLLRVQRSLGHLDKTCSNLQAGKARKALQHARLAEAEAEKAFFEKDMVSQVYFPDEHKVAVYLPLLGPMGVTLLTSLFREMIDKRLDLLPGQRNGVTFQLIPPELQHSN